MDVAFDELKKDGKTDVDSLVTWIKEAEIIKDTKDDEDNVRKLFDDVPDKKNVDLPTFTEILMKIASDKNLTKEDIMKLLLPKVKDVKKKVRGVVADTVAGAVSGARAAASEALKGLFK